MDLRFCPGHLLGRIGMLEHYLDQQKALNEILYLQVRRVTQEEEEEDDTVTLLGLIRLAHNLEDNMVCIIKELRTMVDDGLEKARTAAKAQRKEG